MDTENIKMNAVAGLVAVVLCVGIVAMTVTNALGHGEPLRYGFLLLPVAGLFLWLFGKARDKGRNLALLCALFIAAGLSLGAGCNWAVWLTVSELTPS